MSTGTLEELLAQQASLALQITALQQKEYSAALEQARALITKHGLLQSDLFGSSHGHGAAVPANAKKKVEPKYRDPESGTTWSGRGMTPGWVKGDKSAFLIKKDIIKTPGAA